ncbi:hypothetical protein C8R46DRAFT_1239620 [Mycena filopes]|nr:hypothetical protein C8R46DRAFT_1239620 [Mycena filopes]
MLSPRLPGRRHKPCASFLRRSSFESDVQVRELYEGKVVVYDLGFYYAILGQDAVRLAKAKKLYLRKTAAEDELVFNRYPKKTLEGFFGEPLEILRSLPKNASEMQVRAPMEDEVVAPQELKSNEERHVACFLERHVVRVLISRGEAMTVGGLLTAAQQAAGASHADALRFGLGEVFTIVVQRELIVGWTNIPEEEEEPGQELDPADLQRPETPEEIIGSDESDEDEEDEDYGGRVKPASKATAASKGGLALKGEPASKGKTKAQEVIVISSDDDEDEGMKTPPRDSKRKRAALSSSPLKILDGAPSPTKPPRTKKANTAAGPSTEGGKGKNKGKKEVVVFPSSTG